jgi:hypothetical protein
MLVWGFTILGVETAGGVVTGFTTFGVTALFLAAVVTFTCFAVALSVTLAVT